MDLLRRELEILPAQRECLLPHRRPAYGPAQRLAILQLRRLRGRSSRPPRQPEPTTCTRRSPTTARISGRKGAALLQRAGRPAGQRRPSRAMAELRRRTATARRKPLLKPPLAPPCHRVLAHLCLPSCEVVVASGLKCERRRGGAIEPDNDRGTAPILTSSDAGCQSSVESTTPCGHVSLGRQPGRQ